METNTLKFTKEYTKVVDGEIRRYVITFSINDDCHNGYESFSVTGTVLQKAKNHHWYDVGGGQCWDEVYDKMTPELQNICDQHLCSWEGRPLYAIENGFYHIKNSSKGVVKHYLQLTDEETAEVMGCQSQVELYVYIIDNKIDLRWKENARKAIETLERETGLTFKSQQTEKRHDAYEKFTPEEIMAAREKMQEPGYFSMDKVNAQIQQRKVDEVKESISKRCRILSNDINKLLFESAVYERLSDTISEHPEIVSEAGDAVESLNSVYVHGDSIRFGELFHGFYCNNKSDWKVLAEAFYKYNKEWLDSTGCQVSYVDQNRQEIRLEEEKSMDK